MFDFDLICFLIRFDLRTGRTFVLKLKHCLLIFIDSYLFDFFQKQPDISSLCQLYFQNSRISFSYLVFPTHKRDCKMINVFQAENRSNPKARISLQFFLGSQRGKNNFEGALDFNLAKIFSLDKSKVQEMYGQIWVLFLFTHLV